MLFTRRNAVKHATAISGSSGLPIDESALFVRSNAPAPLAVPAGVRRMTRRQNLGGLSPSATGCPFGTLYGGALVSRPLVGFPLLAPSLEFSRSHLRSFDGSNCAAIAGAPSLLKTQPAGRREVSRRRHACGQQRARGAHRCRRSHA